MTYTSIPSIHSLDLKSFLMHKKLKNKSVTLEIEREKK
jgi:hypothetical protein